MQGYVIPTLLSLSMETCSNWYLHTSSPGLRPKLEDSYCAKERKLIGLLYRQFYNNTDSTYLPTLILDSSTPGAVWELEQVQKFGLRMITNPWEERYHVRLEECGILTLEASHSFALSTFIIRPYLPHICYWIAKWRFAALTMRAEESGPSPRSGGLFM